MRHLSFRRLFVSATLSIAAALPLSAATPELDRLAGEVAAYLDAGTKDGPTSLRLSAQIGWSERIAGAEQDEASRAELLARLAGLRRELADFSPGAQGEGDKANGIFSGRITDDGAPLDQVEVRAYSPSGSFYGSTQTGPDGRYSLSLAPGTYVLYADPYDSLYSPQLYAGISCRLYSTCQPYEGDALVLPSGGQVTADFALADLARIEGVVLDGETMEPVPTEVKVFNRTGNYIGSVPVEADGSYAFGGLEPGTYYVVAMGRDELAGMVYDGVPCNTQRYAYEFTCSREQATALEMTGEQVATGIDLRLVRGAVIAGRASAAGTGASLGGTAQLYTSTFAFVTETYLDAVDGSFGIEGLGPGRYYLAVSASGYTPQFYDRHNCEPGTHCLAGARPIDVVAGETYTFDFQLVLRGSLTGRVIDDRTGLALGGAQVEIWDRAAGFARSWTYSDSAGFFSFSDQPAVEVLILARHEDYRGELFDDVDERRGPAAAKAIRIVPGEVVSGIDLRLSPRGGLRARMVAAEPGGELFSCSLTVVPADDLGAPMQLEYCRENATASVDGLLPGFYYVAAQGYQRARYLYGKGSCNLFADTGNCDFREGTRVEVKSGEETVLGDLRLELAGQIEAYAGFPGTEGAQLRGFLRLYENDGTELPAAALYSPHSTAVYADLAPGSYRLVADGSPEWQSLAYPSAPCSRWFCDPLRSEEIVVEAGAVVPLVEMQLQPISPYTGCAQTNTTLCLNQRRYRVSATWRDFAGASGAGTARELTADSGYFYFFSPGNLEVLVKVLDGCERRLGHHFWFYAAGLTNVQVELRVEDTLTGAVELYSNALGSTFQPILDNGAFATCDAAEAAREAAGQMAAGQEGAPAALPVVPAQTPFLAAEAAAADYCEGGLYFCLGNRFEVGASFRTASGQEGYAGRSRVTPDTATFTFFDYSNVELVVKVLDACSTALPGYWVFASGLTDVAVELTINDRATGRTKTYRQPLGPYVPVIDLGSFPCD